MSSPAGRDLDTESLAAFRDALCVPLREITPLDDPAGARETPLGALHVYKSNRSFTEREVRFCEVLASCLATNLRVLRARRALEADNYRLRVRSPGHGDEMVGDSKVLRDLRDQVARVADSPCSVLIQGESGVGKELVALALHRLSPRHKGPMVTVNCGAIAANLAEAELFGHEKDAYTGSTRERPGYFQLADDGTLFLDEVGELSPACQVLLLRVLETKSFRPLGADEPIKVDVRVIAATNRDLEQEVKAGRFRKDLFYRLGATLKVPPLREHLEDVPALVEHFLEKLKAENRRRVTLSESALQRLQTYCWPGNVRQLRLVLETAVVNTENGGTIHAGDLHLTGETAVPAGEGPPCLNLEELEAWAIRQALARTGWVKTEATKLLGIHRDTMIAKVRKYRIEPGGAASA
jgi:Nif-specific regulatory protein